MHESVPNVSEYLRVGLLTCLCLLQLVATKKKKNEKNKRGMISRVLQISPRAEVLTIEIIGSYNRSTEVIWSIKWLFEIIRLAIF